MRKLLLATTALLALAAAPVKADTFLETGVGVIGAQSVVIGSPVSRNVSAGLIQLNGTGGSFMDVFCVDVFDTIQSPYLYNIATWTPGSTFQGMANINATQAQQIAHPLRSLGSSSNGTGPFGRCAMCCSDCDLAGGIRWCVRHAWTRPQLAEQCEYCDLRDRRWLTSAVVT